MKQLAPKLLSWASILEDQARDLVTIDHEPRQILNVKGD